MFHNAARLAADNWYLLLGAVAAVIIPLWLARLLRGLRPPRVLTLRDKVEAEAKRRRVDIDQMLNWLPQDQAAERRRSTRRTGPPTAIRVAPAPTDDPGAGTEGLVLDRAPGGLCFAIEQPLATGKEVFLRVEGAEPDFPWVAVTVRHCRDCGEYFLIGCEFGQVLPLNIRLQFG